MSDLAARVYDPAHPHRSPLLGRFLSATLCTFGHSVVVMDHDPWDQTWLACSVCGARFMPAAILADDAEVETYE